MEELERLLEVEFHWTLWTWLTPLVASAWIYALARWGGKWMSPSRSDV